MTIIIRESDGARLCRDGKFRTFACFGNQPSCVKVWRHRGWALRKQSELDTRGVRTIARTFIKHEVMDASGHITNRRSDD